MIDRDGMAVTNTYTLEGGYGSHVVIKGTGILLNNEMGDFNKKPGMTNLTGDIGTPANIIAPGKRMLSSMTPTIVLKDGKVLLLTGSPGGRTIINTVVNVVLNVTAFGMIGREAVDAPRTDHEWLPDRLSIEANGAADDVIKKLEAMGHVVRAGRPPGRGELDLGPPGHRLGLRPRRSARCRRKGQQTLGLAVNAHGAYETRSTRICLPKRLPCPPCSLCSV